MRLYQLPKTHFRRLSENVLYVIDSDSKLIQVKDVQAGQQPRHHIFGGGGGGRGGGQGCRLGEWQLGAATHAQKCVLTM